MSSAARIEELQKKFDENPRRYFAPLANECRKAGDLDAAIAICRAHLPQQPGHMSGHIVYGQALFEAGELAEARSVFETALGLDPENLIALRHMGDISARSGDIEGARQWYRRVLETDPRNEEIQQLLASLGGEPAAAPDSEPARDLPTLMDPELVAAAAEGVEQGPMDGLEPTVVELADSAPGAPSDEVAPPELLDFEPTSFGATASLPQEEVPPSLEASVPATGAEAPPLDTDFALDGFEATTFEAPVAPEVPEAGIDREEEIFPTESPAAMPPLDLEAMGFGATGLEPTGIAIPEPEPAPRQDAFATETMAELYLQQGYRDRALDVYRQLVAQNPGDLALRERMERVERAAPSPAAAEFAMEEVEQAGEDVPLELPGGIEPAEPVVHGLPTAMEPALVAAAADAVSPTPSAGPTIREFLVALATGQPLPAAAPAAPPPVEAHVLPELEGVDAPATGGMVAEVVDVAERVGEEGLDSLFGPTDSDDDLRAAEELASAFEPPAPRDAAEPNPLSGRPARPAGTDLSLDHVFAQSRQPGAARPTGSFSFDQFFSEDAVRAPREETPESSAEQGADDDIEQFNSWLKGLRNQ